MLETKYTTPEQIEAMRQTILDAKQPAGRQAIRKRRYQNRRDKFKLVLKVAGWLTFFAVILSLLAILASVNIAKSKGQIPAVFGFYLYKIESGSMEPTLPVGTIILSRKPKNPDALQKKDIVTFKTMSGTTVTHRIIDVLTDDQGNVNYRTKGDNPINSPDIELLVPNRVIAVFLIKIPFT